MYGLVNKAINDLIVDKFGEEVWQEIKTAADVDIEMFTSMKSYDDEITYQLATAASEILELPIEEVLIELGKYWVKFTAKQGYGDMLAMAGNNFPEFLKNLNALHIRVGMTYSNLKPPSFNCEEIDSNNLVLRYFSHRKALGPLVIGLIYGLGEKFNEEIVIKQTKFRTEAGHDEFNIYHNPIGKKVIVTKEVLENHK